MIVLVTFIITPALGMILGGISIIIRNSAQAVYDNLASTIVNENTESKYRATTLSTFNMIRNLPYVLSAYFIGVVMDVLTAKTFVMMMGIFLGIYLVHQIITDFVFKEKKFIKN